MSTQEVITKVFRKILGCNFLKNSSFYFKSVALYRLTAKHKVVSVRIP